MCVILVDMMVGLVFFFFFKQKTAYEMRISDWSSDVCSSDLLDDESGAGAARCAIGLFSCASLGAKAAPQAPVTQDDPDESAYFPEAQECDAVGTRGDGTLDARIRTRRSAQDRSADGGHRPVDPAAAAIPPPLPARAGDDLRPAQVGRAH